MDGYICLQYSVLWGILGLLAMKIGNRLCFTVLHSIPAGFLHITSWILFGILIVDAVGSYAVLHHITKKMPRISAMNDQIDAFTRRLSVRVYRYLERRVERAYPAVQPVSEKKEKTETGVFAEGCSFYKIVLLFIIGAFLGDITETIFCRITAGVWMSRSSLVWGPFSIVWGFAFAGVTLLLYRYKDCSESFLFLMGTFLGGAYEYLCSVLSEIVFGKVFWDYSKIPFNLGGRINLLYCFFWGLASVLWIKNVYPFLSRWIEKVPEKVGKILSWVFLVFMAVNIVLSGMALARYSDRYGGKPAENGVESFLDAHYPDERMERVYPNAIIKE